MDSALRSQYEAISRSHRRAGARLRRRDGDDALREGRLHQPLLRRAEPDRRRPRRARSTRTTCAPAPTSSRPTPSAPTASSCAASAWPTGCATSTSKARAWRKSAARDQAYVAGAIGPLGIRIEPWGKTGKDEAEAYFREQAQALLEGGVDLFILETFRDLNEVGAAIAAVRSVCDLPIVAQMTTEEDGNSLDGTPPEQFAPALEQHGADVIGVNCSIGPAPMLETIERIASITRARLSAQPNAGRPRDIEGRNIYLSSPEYMASYARRFIAQRRAAGRRLLRHDAGAHPADQGGRRRARRRPARRAVARACRRRSVERRRRRGVAGACRGTRRSQLARALAEGRFATIVELHAAEGLRQRRDRRARARC